MDPYGSFIGVHAVGDGRHVCSLIFCVALGFSFGVGVGGVSMELESGAEELDGGLK